ncbi:peptidoglycan DD-metalloendopeptidase family protein [Aquabacterium sp. J223]|uniref:peptidoglycan DD-metalloendopeptidase family protein n=1 Tax=Aquabacterium sp. J223 TaxID=2898431 RepID=UPI0021ADA288|nr:peptidoglycan DD-metalloendopeptidase family protein [Aquabacterium sp. J223]UUX97712.1 peptidoglycan DD-metalloendopeptidase family protein [Aquabacterium sp. J223]
MSSRVPGPGSGLRRWLSAGAIVAVLAGCASPRHRAPVEDRPVSAPRPAATSPVAAAPVTTPLPATPAPGTDPAKPPPPGIENLGKPGHYQVRQGDTLIRIALENGQGWRDIARWNNLDNPNLIEVGQVLRVVPPGVDPTQPITRPVTVARVEPRPLGASAPLPAAPPAAGGASAAAASAPGAAPSAPATPPVATTPSPSSAPAPAPAPMVAAPARDEDEPQWIWPANGPVASSFDEARTKGVGIAGKAGDPVVAAADGRVIYAGSGLRGYGNLVIVKHNASYLTAYAHNQTLLVKEDQPVRRGQKIAEMGSSDAEKVQLHFEIRRQGRPVDPVRLLPPR